MPSFFGSQHTAHKYHTHSISISTKQSIIVWVFGDVIHCVSCLAWENFRKSDLFLDTLYFWQLWLKYHVWILENTHAVQVPTMIKYLAFVWSFMFCVLCCHSIERCIHNLGEILHLWLRFLLCNSIHPDNHYFWSKY